MEKIDPFTRFLLVMLLAIAVVTTATVIILGNDRTVVSSVDSYEEVEGQE